MQSTLRTATRVPAINQRVKKSFIVAALASCVVVQSSFFAAAQVPTDPRTAPVAAAPTPAPVTVPVAQQDSHRTTIVILVKNALLAVNQGNLTGNYTVLRDLASPSFREKNSAADLAAIFQNIRQQKLDLSPIVAIEPVLSQPRIAADGQVALEGYFEAQQMRINFQLFFLKAPTHGWMIHGVSLNAVPLSTTATASSRP